MPSKIRMRSKPIQSQTLFFPTSPRTPFKAIAEIKLFDEELHGKFWNPSTQIVFYHLLKDRDFYEGEDAKDKAFAGRDRINRVPKSLGFVTLPIIGLTEAGKEFLESNNKEEILLRQLLKFQIPSSNHPLGKKAADFYVKPYLELLRLIRDLGTLAFDELHIFYMQLVNINRYELIVEKIKKFREDKELYKGKYREFREKVFMREASIIFARDIEEGNFKTRESKKKPKTKEEFLKTKIRNLRDYADAAVRNLRSTGLINATAVGRTLSILHERKDDVEYILKTIPREPCFISEQEKYEAYLGDASIPSLLTDNKESILATLKKEYNISADATLSINRLKDILNEQREQRQKERIDAQVKNLKDYKLYGEIEETFNTMRNSYDHSLFFEWNTWRAMTMLDGGSIHANLKFDDYGMPMSTALGNMADIECDYGDFDVIVEVTISTGQTQYKMEGEPVPRHLGIHKSKTNKPTYCFFIAPTINSSTVAHFYGLYSLNIELYGGRCNIIPLTLDTFRTMLKKAVESPTKPTPMNIKKLFEVSKKYAMECMMNDSTEAEWHKKITETANNWLSIV